MNYIETKYLIKISFTLIRIERNERKYVSLSRYNIVRHYPAIEKEKENAPFTIYNAICDSVNASQEEKFYK